MAGLHARTPAFTLKGESGYDIGKSIHTDKIVTIYQGIHVESAIRVLVFTLKTDKELLGLMAFTLQQSPQHLH
jgi:hypothetical protein